MILYLICHMADSLAKPRAPSVTHDSAADSALMVHHVACSSSASSQSVLRLSESVSLHAINLPLGLPKMLSELLVSDIFQLLM